MTLLALAGKCVGPAAIGFPGRSRLAGGSANRRFGTSPPVSSEASAIFPTPTAQSWKKCRRVTFKAISAFNCMVEMFSKFSMVLRVVPNQRPAIGLKDKKEIKTEKFGAERSPDPGPIHHFSAPDFSVL